MSDRSIYAIITPPQHPSRTPAFDIPLVSDAMDLNILLSWLWKAAYSIHGEVDAARYKDYILSMLFVK